MRKFDMYRAGDYDGYQDALRSKAVYTIELPDCVTNDILQNIAGFITDDVLGTGFADLGIVEHSFEIDESSELSLAVVNSEFSDKPMKLPKTLFSSRISTILDVQEFMDAINELTGCGVDVLVMNIYGHYIPLKDVLINGESPWSYGL